MKITAIKTNNKTGGYVNISFIPKVEKQMKSEGSYDEEGLDKTDLYVLATLNTIQNR
jgi:hypothetical protein